MVPFSDFLNFDALCWLKLRKKCEPSSDFLNSDEFCWPPKKSKSRPGNSTLSLFCKVLQAVPQTRPPSRDNSNGNWMVWEVTKNLQIMECKWTVATSYKPGGQGGGVTLIAAQQTGRRWLLGQILYRWDTAMHRLVRFSSPLVSKANELLRLVCNAYYA